MKRSKNITREFSFTAAAFNLFSDHPDDHVDAIMEQARSLREREDQLRFKSKMQRLLSQCPGFVGCDPPASASCPGKVVVEPGLIREAMAWLKRRFHVNENLELSTELGLCIEVAPIIRLQGRVQRRRAFNKPEQFELVLV